MSSSGDAGGSLDVVDVEDVDVLVVEVMIEVDVEDAAVDVTVVGSVDAGRARRGVGTVGARDCSEGKEQERRRADHTTTYRTVNTPHRIVLGINPPINPPVGRNAKRANALAQRVLATRHDRPPEHSPLDAAPAAKRRVTGETVSAARDLSNHAQRRTTNDNPEHGPRVHDLQRTSRCADG